MAKTYDPTIPTDKDFVRLWSGDHNAVIASSYLEDEEINAILLVSLNKWYAAASALELIMAQLALRAGGKEGGVVLEKEVEDLRLKFSDAGISNDNSKEALAEYLSWLRSKGATESSKRPTMFRVLRH